MHRPRNADDPSMESFTRRSRQASMAVALAIVTCFAAGCTRSEGSDIQIRCEPREAPAFKDGSLAAAVAKQGAANRAYRECMERKGFRWWS